MTRIYREGRKLLADFNVPEKVATWIRDGMLKFVSVELLRDVKADTREIPWVLDAVALLGSDQPAVGILKSLSLTMARSTALQCRERVAFSRDNPTTGGHKPPMADEPKDDVKALLARLEKAEKDRDSLALKAARTDEAETKLNELQTKTQAEKVNAHRAKLMEAFEAPIKAKTILPSVREHFKRVNKVDSDEHVLSVSVADAEVFMKAYPNPDAPRQPSTVSGTDPNDPADKALAFARAQIRADRDTGKTPDQIVLESIQAQMRSNPELATAWKNAPGGAI